MSPLEIRAIAYAVFAAAMVACGVWLGMHHVQAQWNIDKLAQDKALQAQEANVIAVSKQRDDLQQQVGQAHEQIVANGTALTNSLDNSVRAVEAAVRSGALSGAVVNTGGVQNALAGAAIDPELAAAVGRLNSAISSLATACVQVDADRTSILSLEPKP
jgi:hypothetical protein